MGMGSGLLEPLFYKGSLSLMSPALASGLLTPSAAREALFQKEPDYRFCATWSK